MDVKEIRKDFPALKNYTWFQNGGVSITPNPVGAEHARLMQELLERGPMHIIYPDEEYPRRRLSMERLAHFFSVDPGELALMRGVSEGYQTIIRSKQWQQGDQIIITANEEAALLLPTLHLRDLFGVEVFKAPLVDDADGQVAAVEELITERTRLIGLSHVTTDLGFRLPVRRICDLARQRGIDTFLDLAHSVGLYKMPLRELGCDYAGLLSYKWMYSPYAAGALYIRKERITDVQVTYAGNRGEKSLDFVNDRFELHDTAERFQFGPWSWPLVHAWAFAADYLSNIGLDAIWARTVALTTRLKQGLKEIPGCQIFTPESPQLSAALVSFAIEGWSGKDLTLALRERWKIIVKPLMHGGDGLRVSVTFFQLEEEIDELLERLGQLVAERG
jgi:selenocysteine lyase/cysteine desulfurase